MSRVQPAPSDTHRVCATPANVDPGGGMPCFRPAGRPGVTGRPRPGPGGVVECQPVAMGTPTRAVPSSRLGCAGELRRSCGPHRPAEGSVAGTVAAHFAKPGLSPRTIARTRGRPHFREVFGRLPCKSSSRNRASRNRALGGGLGTPVSRSLRQARWQEQFAKPRFLPRASRGQFREVFGRPVGKSSSRNRALGGGLGAPVSRSLRKATLQEQFAKPRFGRRPGDSSFAKSSAGPLARAVRETAFSVQALARGFAERAGGLWFREVCGRRAAAGTHS